MEKVTQKLVVSAIQMDCVLGNHEENLKKAQIYIEEAVDCGAKLIVLPELFNTGYRVEDEDPYLAEKLPGNTVKWMHEIALKFDVILVAAITEKVNVDGICFDTAIVVDSDGLKDSYRKVYLWDQENVRFRKGSSYKMTDLGELKLGLQICYEVGFPEGARILALQGANILVYPSAFGNARLYAWDIATRARALENGCYLIAANRIGTEKNITEFGGHSRIVSPEGKILSELTYEEGIITAEIELSEVTKQRRTIPYLKDLNVPLIINELNNFVK